MSDKIGPHRIIRWLLSVILIATGLSLTWAWGEVARLAEPPARQPETHPSALYAVWQPPGADSDPVQGWGAVYPIAHPDRRAVLFRSLDEGASWQPLALPTGTEPVAWTSDGGNRLAVALDDGSLLHSQDRGETWTVAVEMLPISCLAWSEAGDLYVGTDGQGIYRLAADGTLAAVARTQRELVSLPVLHLSVVEGRLFAATPTALFYTGADERSGSNWTKSSPAPGVISALAAIDRETVFVGTETLGVFRSADAGQTWQAASEGLGLAAGQMVRVSALRADPREAGALYAAIEHIVGGTHVHSSAAGTFATLDGGASWQPMAGPTFPEAQPASDLVLVAGKSLYVQAVTAGGLQGYAPDVAGALAALEDANPQARVAAARTLGLARAQEAGDALLAVLDDPDPAVGQAVADALGRIDDPATASGLLVALEHPVERVRLSAARALGIMRVEAAVKPLRTMLLNDQREAVGVAADALGRIGSPASTDALLVALADPVRTTRWHAAMAALEAMGEPAVGPLTGMLGNKDPYARRNAAEALGWIGSPSATAALVDTLEDKSPGVREQAAWALGEIGDPAARRALERMLARDPSAAVQAAARAALARVDEKPPTVAPWPAIWAPILQRLQIMRWLLLALSLVGAAWLAVDRKSLPLLPVLQRDSRR